MRHFACAASQVVTHNTLYCFAEHDTFTIPRGAVVVCLFCTAASASTERHSCCLMVETQGLRMVSMVTNKVRTDHWFDDLVVVVNMLS